MDKEEKMKIVINNYFKKECSVNTSIREAFEKGFRIGVSKVQEKQGEWIDERNDDGACLAICSKCRTLEITGCFCRTCGSNNTDSFMKLFNCGAAMQKGGAEE